jgi:hypothetical protein
MTNGRSPEMVTVRNRTVGYEIGPLHGGGDKYLYDLEQNKVVAVCHSRSGAECPPWGKY